MVKKDILPSVSAYSQSLANTLLAKKSVSKALNASYEQETLTTVCNLQQAAYSGVKALENALETAYTIKDVTALAAHCKSNTLQVMQELRSAIDKLEEIVSSDYWPFPTYGDLLFSV